MVSTVETIQRELMSDGLVLRYTQQPPASLTGQADVDGLTGGEGAFLACSFWLANALQLIGRYDEAVTLFERMLTLRNDIGLLAEEYDPRYSRQVGNFPQAFSHMPLIQSALNLEHHAEQHRRGRPPAAAGSVNFSARAQALGLLRPESWRLPQDRRQCPGQPREMPHLC